MFPQYNDYGRVFWIPTHMEPTVALIGTSMPAMLQVYSAASLQFSKLRSRLSSRGGSDATKSYKEDTAGKNSGSLRFRALETNNFQEISGSEIQLNPMPSFPSMRSDGRTNRFEA